MDVLSKVNIRNLADITVKKVLNLSNFGKKLSTFVGSEGLRWSTLCKNRCYVDKFNNYLTLKACIYGELFVL